MLRDISQNLPALSHTLAREKVKEDLKKSIIEQAEQVAGYSDIIWINRVAYPADTVDPFMLYKTVEDQLVSYHYLRSLSIRGSPKLFDLLALRPPSSDTTVIVDVDTPLIDFYNDLRTDDNYRRWPRSIEHILRPVYSGHLHYIAQNIFTLVSVLNPGTIEGLKSSILLINYLNQLPVRVGLLFDVRDELGELAFKLWKELFSRGGMWSVVNWVANIVQQHTVLTENALLHGYPVDTRRAEANPRWEEELRQTQAFLSSKFLSSETHFLNGHLLEIGENKLVQVIYSKILELRPQVQQWVNQGFLTTSIISGDGFDLYSWMLKKTGALPFFDPLIFLSKKDMVFVSLKDLPVLPYVRGISSRDAVTPITHIIVGNLNNDNVRNSLKSVVNLFDQPPDQLIPFRVGWINTDYDTESPSYLLHKALSSLPAVSDDPSKYLPAFRQLLEISGEEISHESMEEVVQGSKIDYTSWEEAFENDDPNLLNQLKTFVEGDVALEPGEWAILTNGRLLRLSEDREFSSESWKMLSNFEYKSRTKYIQETVEQFSYTIDGDFVTSDFLSDVQFKIASFLNMRENLPEDHLPPPPKFPPSFEVKDDDPDMVVDVTIDPVSTNAQRLSSLLIALKDHFDVHMKVILRTPKQLSGLPLKNFYRFVLDTIQFDSEGNLSPNQAVFVNIPQKRLLSMTVQVPGSWLVSSHDCEYDLDNIILDNIPKVESMLRAVFQLDHILVEGSCSDISNNGFPPRALGLILGDVVEPHQQDSLVMSNLGYFQLKASPNVWNLQLASGQSRLLYQVEGPTGIVLLDSWSGAGRNLKVKKSPGMEQVSLFSNIFTEDNHDERIHVFSLASGHLYERFLKVMMMSVINHTKSPVKFWLLSNFLSPQFKAFVPKYAAEFNFEVELVTYKWPEWLNKQTEKQRIIWGYKILFLDVLFPVNLHKIIYVDADQIVRTDLKELMDFDLEGAPYGYTPFCTGHLANPLTKGFRFWSGGFWADHLSGKPYHISALYVVDLYQLRRSSAADRLRATYNQLSLDPNSLANLDQDLPNYLQWNIPIKSLPENWLWCETWCKMEAKDHAKTIDLCNNPLTKTPKLEAALKFVPEWSNYDNVVKQFEQNLTLEELNWQELEQREVEEEVVVDHEGNIKDYL
eukprot:TRINITY_DN1573_c0_g2_i10.p1 TRINITY_DN1573_c0_g2~~TRINITY_DN1573_c0_g2_i10.p1  ORF type:complete len:1144 (-),score=275.63 TRINITY_DN1573_c0_g2_i10:25-3456(-)